MKTIKFSGLILLLGLVACGGNKEKNSENEEIVMTPESTEVSGQFKGCYTVVDRNYKITGGLYPEVTIELERTDKDLPLDMSYGEVCGFDIISSRDNHNQVGFGIEFLDEDGNILGKDEASSGNNAKESVALTELPNGEKGSISFSIPYSMSEEDKSKIKKFRITSAYREKEGWSSDSSASNSDSESDSDSESESVSSINYNEVYEGARKQAQDMYDQARKQAQDMYDEALEDAKELYGW